MNKEIDTDSRQLDRKLFDLIHLLVALIFFHIRRSIPLAATHFHTESDRTIRLIRKLIIDKYPLLYFLKLVHVFLTSYTANKNVKRTLFNQSSSTPCCAQTLETNRKLECEVSLIKNDCVGTFY